LKKDRGDKLVSAQLPLMNEEAEFVPQKEE